MESLRDLTCMLRTIGVRHDGASILGATPKVVLFVRVK